MREKEIRPENMLKKPYIGLLIGDYRMLHEAPQEAIQRRTKQ